MRYLASLVLSLFIMSGNPALAQDQGRFVEFDLVTSQPIKTPHITVWLPPGYGAGKGRYGVVYMHDAQNLFFPEKSNYNKVWAADKSALRLIAAKKTAPFIIVGIDHPGKDRMRQYYPNALLPMLSAAVRANAESLMDGANLSDAYLDFLTHELKPKIDHDYRTKADRKHTAIIGSSMGGLISFYAITQHPDIFGMAGCVSTHTPLADPAKLGDANADVIAAWDQYVSKLVGKPKGRRIWFDHGDQTLDAFYGPYQKSLDAALLRSGWRAERDFTSRIYPGAAHEENAWAARMDDIFGWLLVGWK
jgi:predicted alpha/beta superfamily hydrolase